MTDNEQEQIYSIALTMVPGIGHIGAKRLVEGMKSATDVFRFRKELAQRLSGVTGVGCTGLSVNYCPCRTGTCIPAKESYPVPDFS